MKIYCENCGLVTKQELVTLTPNEYDYYSDFVRKVISAHIRDNKTDTKHKSSLFEGCDSCNE